ncbi:MAG: IMP dehydrogenase [Bacteroidales bacterium]
MAFDKEKIQADGYTFDDVLLIPQYSDVLPHEVDLSTKFSKKIHLNIPIVSAAMDTVTESGLAIAMARLGGIGVVHKNMSISEQARHIKTVKRAENGMIYDPITIKKNSTIGDAVGIMKDYKIGGIPVVDDGGILIGIVTNRDLRFEQDYTRTVEEVMTKDNIITTSQSIDLEKATEILKNYRIEKLPVIDDGNKLVGLLTYKDITKAKDNPNACKDKKGRLRVAGAVGATHDALARAEALINENVDAIVIDTAHAHSRGVFQTLNKLKNTYPDMEVIVGNIGTAEAARDLLKAGADALKVGIGPGSICTTRVVAGVGLPQLSAIYDVAREAARMDVPIIADGGLRYSGDLVKAIAAGADSIMAGSLFAGVEESPGDTIIYQGRKFKTYRGMGSVEAMQRGSKDRYFQNLEEDVRKLVPEGITGRVPFKGNLSEVVYQLIGGLKAGMGYCGSQNIKQLKEARFMKITSSGVIESHPHDVAITREAPNYSPHE